MKITRGEAIKLYTIAYIAIATELLFFPIIWLYTKWHEWITEEVEIK